jgi:hypothetical protein
MTTTQATTVSIIRFSTSGMLVEVQYGHDRIWLTVRRDCVEYVILHNCRYNLVELTGFEVADSEWTACDSIFTHHSDDTVAKFSKYVS